MLTDLFFRVRALFRRKAIEEELNDELSFHFEQQLEKYQKSGYTRDQALRRLRIEFGGLDQIKDDCRETRGVNFIETLFQDLRYGLRTMRRSTGFTAVAVITLAVGIGANAAIFSVVETILLRSLPFKDASRLIDITEYSPGRVDSAGVPYPDYLVWKQETTAFEETGAYFLIRASNDIVLGGPFSTERARYSIVSNSFFTILGVQPALGHGFGAADETPGGPKNFLISDALWHATLGSDPHAIGKSYLLDGETSTLVGVMPASFDYPNGCGIWVPISALGQSGLHDRISHSFHVLGRLRRGMTRAAAEAQVESVQKHLGQTYPNTDAGWRVRAVPLLDQITGNVRTSLLILLGAVGFILLIACTNVVNLMLARASAREREFAVRTALGAGRMRLLRQNLTEASLIVCISIVLSVALANVGLTLIVSLTSIHLPRMESMAKKFWPGTNPIGQRLISIDDRSNPREIVGVVHDVKSFGLNAESKPEMYTLHGGAWYMNLVLRTSQNPTSVVSAVRQQVVALDRGVPVYQVATMDQLISDSIAPERFETLLLALFASLALALAAIGLYGVLAFGVSKRTHEFGIRMALGAQRAQILRLVAGEGMRLVLIGISIGLLASLLLTRLMASLLYGVRPTNGAAFASVTALLVLVAVVASYIPAHRAMRVDPLIALRDE